MPAPPMPPSGHWARASPGEDPGPGCAFGKGRGREALKSGPPSTHGFRKGFFPPAVFAGPSPQMNRRGENLAQVVMAGPGRCATMFALTDLEKFLLQFDPLGDVARKDEGMDKLVLVPMGTGTDQHEADGPVACASNASGYCGGSWSPGGSIARSIHPGHNAIQVELGKPACPRYSSGGITKQVQLGLDSPSESSRQAPSIESPMGAVSKNSLRSLLAGLERLYSSDFFESVMSVTTDAKAR